MNSLATIVKTLIYPFLLGWFGALLVVIVAPLSLIALPFSVKHRTSITAPGWYLFFNIVMRTVFWAKTISVDERSDEEKRKTIPNGLYIANHHSFVDIPLLFSHLIIPPIMKKEVLYIPVLGILAYSSGAIILDRKDKQSRRKALIESQKRLTSGHHVLQYYPEGTRQKGNKPPKDVSQIKTPLIEFAYKNNIPVYPVSLFGTNKVINSNATINPFKKVGIKLHAARMPENFSEKEDFIKQVWNDVTSGYHELENKVN